MQAFADLRDAEHVQSMCRALYPGSFRRSVPISDFCIADSAVGILDPLALQFLTSLCMDAHPYPGAVEHLYLFGAAVIFHTERERRTTGGPESLAAGKGQLDELDEA